MESNCPKNYYKITIAVFCVDSFMNNLKESCVVHKNIFEDKFN